MIEASHLDADALLHVLEVARRLSGPYELGAMLTQVIDAGRQALGAERGSLFLYDAQARELVAAVATDAPQIRFGVEKGAAGECARTGRTIRVDDAYSDPRFNPEVDRQTGYRTRCLITTPLVGLDDELVGVLQLLNPNRPCFTSTDERIVEALAGHAAAAIQRARLLEERLVKLKLERDLDLAREIQRKVLPAELPRVPGYDLAAFSQPADQTGGDIYDLILLQGAAGQATPAATGTGDAAAALMLLIADATGHGIGPALSVTQVRAMLRVALRLGAGLDDVLRHINRQLHEDLGGGRFVTAFLGRLDPGAHRLDYHAAGQGPLLHFVAARRACEWHGASTFPLGVVPDLETERPEPIHFARGDVLVLLTDGFYEFQDETGQLLGRQRIADAVTRHRGCPARELLDALREEVRQFAGGARQLDDLTAVIIRREE